MDVTELHDIYYNKHKSLTRTAKFASKKLGVEINRHQLADLFRGNDLPIHPPNGRNEADFHKPIVTPEHKIIEKLFKAVSRDIVGYWAGKKIPYIDYISACWFLANNVDEGKIKMIVDVADSDYVFLQIRDGCADYEDLMTRWVLQ